MGYKYKLAPQILNLGQTNCPTSILDYLPKLLEQGIMMYLLWDKN